ncbi:DUF6221 family protein [Streptomyces sp. NPDC006923]|uniref:DUF6221 family protein n=1 Tax=Streptomyces sp. NPDC006923 TaxID=3155355 RepID=UPI0033FC3192
MSNDQATMVAFVRARLYEEEQIAKAAGGDTWWSPPDLPGEVHDELGGIAFAVKTRGYDTHIARQNPASTLRRIEASRVVLDEYAAVAELDTDTPAHDYPSGRAVGLGFAVRNMAAEYADHPDYRASWLPRFT